MWRNRSLRAGRRRLPRAGRRHLPRAGRGEDGNVFRRRDGHVLHGWDEGVFHGKAGGRVGGFTAIGVVARRVRVRIVEQTRPAATQQKSKKNHRAKAPHALTMAARLDIRQVTNATSAETWRAGPGAGLHDVRQVRPIPDGSSRELRLPRTGLRAVHRRGRDAARAKDDARDAAALAVHGHVGGRKVVGRAVLARLARRRT